MLIKNKNVIKIYKFIILKFLLKIVLIFYMIRLVFCWCRNGINLFYVFLVFYSFKNVCREICLIIDELEKL